MHSPEKLLLQNKAWSQDVRAKDPDFYKKLVIEEHPDFLWIGCSDSLVPAETVVNAQPGEIFVHRNIANQVITTDFNFLSALQYAIAVLKVKHIIVCGHYGCGGVIAALRKQSSELIVTNKWLMHVKDVYRLHQDELESIAQEKVADRLIELNIIEQVHRLTHTSIVQSAWKRDNTLTLHGWVYGIEDGLIKELIKLDYTSPIHSIYQYTE